MNNTLVACCALCLSLPGLPGCFSTVTRTHVPDEPFPESAVTWNGPFEPTIDGVVDASTGKLVLQALGTYRADALPPVQGTLEECSEVSGTSLLLGEIGGGIGVALGGSLLGVGAYEASAGCEDGDCIGAALGQTAAGALLLALSATLLAVSAAIDLRYDSDQPFDCAAGETVDIDLPPPSDRREAVRNFAAVAPGPEPGTPTLVPADETGRVTLDADAYLGCPERCVLPADPAFAEQPDVRPFLEDMAVEVPLVLLAEDGSPGETLGSHRFRISTVRFAALLDGLARREAEDPARAAFVPLTVRVLDAGGRPVPDAEVRLAPPDGGTAVGAAPASPLLDFRPLAPEWFAAALDRALAARWLAAPDAPAGAQAAPGARGTSRTGPTGTALFLVPPNIALHASCATDFGHAETAIDVATGPAEVTLTPAPPAVP